MNEYDGGYEKWVADQVKCNWCEVEMDSNGVCPKCGAFILQPERKG
jgi:tRNA(Ile2) C34 agmatinyltransferase TiaS